jgi:hypothetical protein
MSRQQQQCQGRPHLQDGRAAVGCVCHIVHQVADSIGVTDGSGDQVGTRCLRPQNDDEDSKAHNGVRLPEISGELLQNFIVKQQGVLREDCSMLEQQTAHSRTVRFEELSCDPAWPAQPPVQHLLLTIRPCRVSAVVQTTRATAPCVPFAL